MREFRGTISGVRRGNNGIETMQGVSQWDVINLVNTNFN
jgi:hypothetical protein